MARAKCRWRAKERGALRHAQRGDTGDDTHHGQLGDPGAAGIRRQDGALIAEQSVSHTPALGPLYTLGLI